MAKHMWDHHYQQQQQHRRQNDEQQRCINRWRLCVLVCEKEATMLRSLNLNAWMFLICSIFKRQIIKKNKRRWIDLMLFKSKSTVWLTANDVLATSHFEIVYRCCCSHCNGRFSHSFLSFHTSISHIIIMF